MLHFLQLLRSLTLLHIILIKLVAIFGTLRGQHVDYSRACVELNCDFLGWRAKVELARVLLVVNVLKRNMRDRAPLSNILLLLLLYHLDTLLLLLLLNISLPLLLLRLPLSLLIPLSLLNLLLLELRPGLLHQLVLLVVKNELLIQLETLNLHITHRSAMEQYRRSQKHRRRKMLF